MLFTTIAAAALFTTPSAADTTPVAPPPAVARHEEHGKLAWFSGTFEEALAKAKAEKKVIFIDFWTTWCGWCKKLDKVTYSDDSVVALMKDVICLSIDAESESGAALAAKYPPQGYPTMYVLESDGTVRDRLVGYLDPAKFKDEITRIRTGKGSVAELRQLVDADKLSVDKRWTLAKKLKELGDQKSYDEQVAEIKKLDPKGESEAMHRIAFDGVLANAQVLFEQGKGADTPALFEQFLATEKYGPILWEGWMVVANIHGQLAQGSEQTEKPDDKAKHEAAQVKAWRLSWPHVSAEEFVGYGTYLAANFYERRETLGAEDKAFALDLAKKLEVKADKDARALDAIACCYFMNGKKDDALKVVRKCVELEPDSAEFKQRLSEFGG